MSMILLYEVTYWEHLPVYTIIGKVNCVAEEIENMKLAFINASH